MQEIQQKPKTRNLRFKRTKTTWGTRAGTWGQTETGREGRLILWSFVKQLKLNQSHFLSLQMSWSSSFHRSKFHLVFGKPAAKRHRYVGVPITRSIQDNHYCSANPRFIAVVTECAGGGAFLVLPIHHVCMSSTFCLTTVYLIYKQLVRMRQKNLCPPQTGRVEPHHPRVHGHSGRVLDVKWNPFDDYCIASCSEDCTVRHTCFTLMSLY